MGGLTACTKIIYDLKTVLIYAFLLFCPLWLTAQVPSKPEPKRNSPTTAPKSQLQEQAPKDSLPQPAFSPQLSPNDSLSANDTLRQKIRISPDSLSTKVEYYARDSIINDLLERKTYLYGNARVQYEDILLEADYIELDWNQQELHAHGLPDSSGLLQGRPRFSDGSQEFQAKELRYNFSSRKGFIIDGRSTYEDLYLHTRQAKFISDIDTAGHDLIYGQSAIFTTCNAEHPHYGIRSTKQKIITDKIVIVGPSNLELLDVPSPLWLPFGFFPLSKKRSTGLIFPRDYNYDPNFGFGFQNVGWYFPVGDRLGLQLTTDLYFKGSFRLRVVGDYAKRYKYRGQFRLEYANLLSENALAQVGRRQTFLIQIDHKQDQRAHPSRNIGGSINIQTGNALQLNYNDANSQLTNTLRSNFSWRESFPGKPYSLSLNFNHSQNTQTQKITINFPTFNFQTLNLYPFKRKEAVGSKKWYEDIVLTYSTEAKATLSTIDTLLFSPEIKDDIRYGARHNASMSSSFKLFKYLNLNPSVNYKEYWYFDHLQRSFDPDTSFIYKYEIDSETGDTLQATITDTLYGQILTDTLRQFSAVRQFDVRATLNTKLFGTVLFRKGPLRGLRHIMTPSISLVYEPDYTRPGWGYFQALPVDSRKPDSLIYFNRFQGALYGTPSTSSQGLRIDYSLRNIFEAKLFSPRDSGTHNIALLRRFDLKGSYSLAAEEFKFSQLTLDGTTNLLWGLSTVNFNFRFDPYETNEDGQRINTFVWDKRRKPLRFVSGNLNLTFARVSLDRLRKLINEKQNKPQKETSTNELLDFFSGLSLSYNLRWTFLPDTAYINTHSIDLRGSLPLSELWRVQIGSFGYDFHRKRITYPSFTISRDLHCWEMGLSWYPTNDAYTFYLRVDTGTPLDFINIPYNKGTQSTFTGFR